MMTSLCLVGNAIGCEFSGRLLLGRLKMGRSGVIFTVLSRASYDKSRPSMERNQRNFSSVFIGAGHF